MNPDTLRLILTSATAVLVGGGGLRLVEFLLRRRSDLRKLDSEADAMRLDSANAYIKTLQEGERAVRADLAVLNARLDEKDTQMERLREALADERREAARARTELAVIRSDLDVARAQVVELSRRLQPPPT